LIIYLGLVLIGLFTLNQLVAKYVQLFGCANVFVFFYKNGKKKPQTLNTV
jgi:hypothetical protein